MDLLDSERFDGFCIVSSDSDFPRPARAPAQVRPHQQPNFDPRNYGDA